MMQESRSSLTPDLVKSIKELLVSTRDIQTIKTQLNLTDCQVPEVEDLLYEAIAEEKKKFGNNFRKMSVCFLLDGTGSMKSFIDMAKKVITNLMDEVNKKIKTYEVSFGIVVYRDFDMGQKSIEVLNFTKEQEEIKNFLNGIICTGGEDAPEDIFGGFQKMLELDWKVNGINVLFHIADCPCHGKGFHDLKDSFSEAQSESDWKKLFVKSKREFHMNYYFFEINKKATAKMCKKFQQIWDGIEVPKKLIKSIFRVQEISQDIPNFFTVLMNSIIQSVNATY